MSIYGDQLIAKLTTALSGQSPFDPFVDVPGYQMPVPVIPRAEEMDTFVEPRQRITTPKFVEQQTPTQTAQAAQQGPVDPVIQVRNYGAQAKTLGDFATRALTFEGLEYEYGGTTRKTGLDCSGLIWRIMQKWGYDSFPRVSHDIIAHSKKISLKKALKTRGAILYGKSAASPSGGHIAISLGNGKTIEAMGEAYGVVVGEAEGRFTHGGVLPELQAGAPRRRRRAKHLPPERVPAEVNALEAVNPLASLPVSFASVLGELQEPKPQTARAYERYRSAQGLGFAPARYRSMFTNAARRYNLNPRLLAAVAQIESNFRPDAVSSAGAQGIMQLMPFWAETYGEKALTNPKANIMAGAAILAGYINQMGSVRAGLAAYNGGPGNPQFDYADKVLDVLRGRVNYA